MISNALKYTSDGNIQVHLSKIFEDTKPFLKFEIRDTGIGIPIEKK